MRDKQTINILIEDAIALCHIGEDFEEFNKRLIDLLNSEKSAMGTTLHKLSQISKGEKCLASQSLKQFYIHNKKNVDIIREYSNVLDFVFSNYNFSSNIEFTKNNFYQYILAHKLEIANILNILEKLKDLGFYAFKFNPDLKFTDETYNITTNAKKNKEIIYLENLETIPSYDKSTINYTTRSSCYKISCLVPSTRITNDSNQIILNDLTFDPKRLPQEIVIEEIFDKILSLKQEKNREYSILRNSVDLSIGIEDLYSMYNEVNNRFVQLEGVDSKEELLDELRKVKEALDQMTLISQQYDTQMISSTDGITEKLLTEEKTAYVRRREWEKIDLC